MLPDWIPERIRSRITIENRGYHEGECWIVSGWDDGKGHKKIRWGGICTFVHRVMLALHLEVEHHELDTVDHLCRQRACCKPTHLEDTTVKVNTDRGLGVLTQFRSPVDMMSTLAYEHWFLTNHPEFIARAYG